MEHAGGRRVQLSVGAEMEAYGDQAATARHNYAASRERSQEGNLAIAGHLKLRQNNGQCEIAPLSRAQVAMSARK